MTLDLSQFEPRAPVAYDSSMIGTYLRCPRLFYLEYILGLRKAEQNVALSYGSLWHEVMELWQNERDVEAVQELIHENASTFSIHDPKNRTTSRMFEDFVAYLQEYAQQDQNIEIVAIEQGFDLELPNGIRYTGRIDEVLKDNGDSGRVFINDHKTTTFFTKNYFENHELGIQLKGYLWAVQQLMPAAEVHRARLNVYHILKNETKFYRRNFDFRQTQIEEWLTNVCFITAQIQDLVDNHLENPSAWILNSGQRCADYGGCPFLLVHQMPPERGNRERLLKHEFEIRRWDPITGEDNERARPEG